MFLTEQVNVALMIGKTENVHERMQFIMEEWRIIGDPRFTAFALHILSQSALILERYDEARLALEESVALNIQVGARWNLGFAYQGLAAVAQAQRKHQQAMFMYRKSLDTFTELGGRQFVAQGLAEMGRSIFALGNEAEAERVWLESLRIAAETRGIPVALEALADLASLRAKQGHAEYALVLLLIVLNHPASTQDTRNRASHQRLELEAQLTSQQVVAAQTQAQAETLEVAVDKILKRL